jgi:hypothetical protein
MATYATLAELKARLGIGDTVDDNMLTDALNTASREIEQHTRRIFTATTAGTARVFEATDWWQLDFGDFHDLTTLATLATDGDGNGVYETTWASTDYELNPVNGDGYPEARPYETIRAIGTHTFPVPASTGAVRRHLVQVTGTWGWSAVPAAIKETCLLLAAEGFKAKDSPFGVAGVADFGVIRIRDNALVARKLAPYVRGTGSLLVG